MTMPSYFRFPETETLENRFWGSRPRNPTCGLIGLEKGAKTFLWVITVYSGLVLSICVIFFLLPLFNHNRSTHDDQKALISGLTEDSDLPAFETIMFLGFLFSAFLLHVSWKLKKSVDKRDVPQLKKYFFVFLALLIIDSLPILYESEVYWSKAFFLDIPGIIFVVIGLVFVHSFILSLINPENSQHDDLNRIQFSP